MAAALAGGVWLAVCPPLVRAQGGGYIRTDPTLVEEVDSYHAAISERVLQTAMRIDEFFAEDRILEENRETLLRVQSALRYDDGRDLTFRLNLSGRFVMPHLEEQLQLFFDTDGRERDLKEGLKETPAVTEDDRSLFTGIRYTPRDTRRTRLNLDGGLRWHSGPQPFARVRGRRTFLFDYWAMRVTQTAFWFNHRGVGLQTKIDFERWLDEQHFFRARPSAVWSEESEGVDLRQTFNIYHTMNEDTLVGIDLDVQGHTWPSAKVDKYEASLRWRQRTYRDWMFFEISPGLAFPRDNDFQLTPIITLRLEVLFGDFPVVGGRP